MSTGAERIQVERDRQLLVKGFHADRDDEYINGELAIAASAYVVEAVPVNAEVEAIDGLIYKADSRGTPPPWWPWDASWWKPSDDPIDNLVKAGALIAAEIDRLQRAAR